ncbi:hypothetical protein E9993_11475 [Labilibacter sediminis]|nr:hypothetical protein E9993_11475 [Labilibacter sediminis]
MKKLLPILILALSTYNCSEKKIEKKGFQVSEITEDKDGQKVVGLQMDSLKLETKPRNVLLTNNPNHRLTPIYKVNYDKNTGKPFTGSNYYHTTWEHDYDEGNNWNNNFMPGFEAVYGYNFINIAHYNNKTNTQNEFFEEPVLIKTLYYPAFSKDTLNHKPIKRDYYMVSVYDEDTNNDGFISTKDLRRFYLFDINGNLVKPLVPKNYSVMSSEYDSANDFMYVFARVDQNKNGQMEYEEETHIFWIDLKNPENNGVQYKNQ